MKSSSTIAIVLGASLLSSTLCYSAGPQTVHPDLLVAYQRLQFSQLYPPEAVAEIQNQLQNSQKPIEVLARLAADARPEVRVLVAALLSELGDTEGAKLLWQLLRDDEESVRIAATGGLIRLSALTTVPVQVDGLQDRRDEVRQLSAAVLCKLRDKSAEQPLIEVLSDTNEMVRMEAARALGACGTAERSVPALAKLVDDPSVLVRTATANSLGAFDGASTTECLIKGLSDPDWHVRAAAALSLRGRMNGEQRAQISTILIPKLREDKFALVRDRSADSLTSANDESAVQALVEAVVSGEREVSIHAGRSIINAKAVRALPLLEPHLNHPKPTVRQKIIEIYGALGGEAQIPAVMAALDDKNPMVQISAVQALRQIGSRADPAALTARLKDQNPHVRAAVVRALGDMGNRTVTPQILPLLRDDDSFVRGAAAEALGKLGDRSAIFPLIQLLGGEAVAGAATKDQDGIVIGNQKDSFLTELSRETVIDRKAGAIKALGVLRATEALDPLIDHGLKSGDAKLQALSAYALGQIGDKRAVVPLEDTIMPFYNAAIMETTGPIINTGENTVPDDVRRSTEEKIRVRASVVWALGQIGDPAAESTLLKAAEDNNSLVRDQAVEALQKLKERQERQALEETEKKVASEKKTASR
jgi:HEAT repeat protein